MKNLKNQKDFLSIKESISISNTKLLDRLAEKIASEEEDEGTLELDVHEFIIEGISFYVTGVVNYIYHTDKGDFYTPPYTDREFYSADLEIVWNDGTMDDDIPLEQKEINYIISRLERLN